MELNYNGIFQFPERCLRNKRLTKKFFTKHFDLTSTEKKLLNTNITKMEWVASIKPAHSNIPKFENDLYVFDEIQVMTCKVSTSVDKVVKSVAELFQKYIPYPIVLVIEDDTHWILSTCDKRINQKDAGKRTIENHFIAPPIDIKTQEENSKMFIKTLSYVRLNKTNLKTVYEAFTDSIIQLKYSTLTGVFNEARSKHQDLKHMLQVEAIETELISLKSQLTKETQLNIRVSINMEIQNRKKEIQLIINN